MSKKVEKLIKRLKEAKDILNKDDIDDKIKAKMMAEMKRRNFGEADATRHVIDRDKGNKMPKIKKPKEPLLQSEDEKLHKAKVEAVKNLFKTAEKTEVKKSANDMADELLKSLEEMGGLSKTEIPQRRPVNGQIGWSQDPATGAFHHKLHGVVSTLKDSSGGYTVRHSGKTLGTFDNIQDAAAKVKDHINTFNSKAKTVIKDEDSEMHKGMSAAEIAEQQVMQKLAKTVGSMMPMNAKLQPTQDEFEQAMLAQGLAFTPEQLAKMDNNWNSTMSGFYAEANKPISTRFASEEEEEAYWANIKVSDRGDNGPGY